MRRTAAEVEADTVALKDSDTMSDPRREYILMLVVDLWNPDLPEDVRPTLPRH
jgi:hypothetical protein